MPALATDAIDEILSVIRTLGAEVTRLGATGVFIFGSRARGDHRRDSDLDVFVDYEPDSKFSAFDLLKIKHLIEDATGLEVHITTRRSFKSETLAKVERDAIRAL